MSVPLWLLVCCFGAACADDDNRRTPRPDSGAPRADGGALNEDAAARVPEDDAGDVRGLFPPVTCGPQSKRHLTVYRGEVDLNSTQAVSWPEIKEEFEGTVEEIRSGIPSALDPFRGETPPGAAYMRVIASTGESWTIVARDLDTFGVQRRAAVRLVVQRSSGYFYTPLSMRVQVYEMGALRIAYAENADLPEAFAIEPGAELCTQTNRCGTWSSNKLRVRGPCAEIAEIEPYGRGTVCDYEVRPGRYVLERNQARMCDDWFMRGMEVIVIAARGQ